MVSRGAWAQPAPRRRRWPRFIFNRKLQREGDHIKYILLFVNTAMLLSFCPAFLETPARVVLVATRCVHHRPDRNGLLASLP